MAEKRKKETTMERFRRMMGIHEPSVENLILDGKVKEAERILRRRLEAKPSDIYAHRKLGDIMSRDRKRWRDAVRHYRNAAHGLANDGFYEKAEALLGRALKLQPDSVELREKEAEIRRTKRFVNAQRDIFQAGSMTTGKIDGGTEILEALGFWRQLSTHPLVDELPESQLRRLMQVMIPVRPKPGEHLGRPGEPGDALYLIVSGTVQAFLNYGKFDQVMRSYEEGQIFGESVLLEHRDWLAHYRATAGTKLLKLDRAGLEKALLGNDNPVQLLKVLRAQGCDGKVLQMIENPQLVDERFRIT